jgi:hypothetical protein
MKARGQELVLGKIDDPHHAEDDSQPGGDPDGKFPSAMAHARIVSVRLD